MPVEENRSNVFCPHRIVVKPRGGLSVRALTCLIGLLLISASAGGAGALEIVVPAYFFPSTGGDWDRMNAAAAEVPLTAIMNPNSGPGSVQNASYTNAVGSLRQAGGKVIGYVASGYGNRPLDQVLAEIDTYENWYDIDGIFLDEMSNTSDSATLDFYEAIYSHTKNTNAGWELMGNPGTATQEAYLTRPTADRLMVFESFGNQYPGHTPSAWNSNYDSDRFVNLLHTQSDEADALGYVDLAASRGVGGIYFTDDVLSNPWDRLPTYWESFVDKVAEVNSRVIGPLQTLSHPVAAGEITIDGSRADWGGLEPYSPDADGAAPSPLDLVSLTLANDDDELFVRLTLDAASGTPPALGNDHRVYLDIDGDRGTGYLGDSSAFALGADYMLLGDRLFAFQGSTQQTFSWDFLEELSTDDSTPADIEWAVPLAQLEDPLTIDLFVQGINTGEDDFLPNSSDEGVLGNYFRYQVGNAPIIGDFDGDGDVDLDDYTRWRQRFGSADALADGNGDGAVNAADYTIWRDAFVASSAVVPEPTALAMTLALTGFFVLGRPLLTRSRGQR